MEEMQRGRDGYEDRRARRERARQTEMEEFHNGVM